MIQVSQNWKHNDWMFYLKLISANGIHGVYFIELFSVKIMQKIGHTYHIILCPNFQSTILAD